jgi:hypothetical protein
MAFGKWCMYLSGVLFLAVGVGALVVAFVPSFDDEFGIVRSTGLILGATFIPCAFLFFWCGRWFKSLQPSFNSMMDTSAQMARNSSAMYQQYGQVPGSPVPGSGVLRSGGGASGSSWRNP